MTLRSRFLRHWYVNNLFDDAICMDGQCDELWNDLRLDGTLEPMWIVSACHVQEDTENNTRRQTNTRRCTECATTASELCFNKHNNTLDQSA